MAEFRRALDYNMKKVRVCVEVLWLCVAAPAGSQRSLACAPLMLPPEHATRPCSPLNTPPAHPPARPPLLPPPPTHTPQTGKTLMRGGRRSKPPQRPKEGWTMVVKQLGKQHKGPGGVPAAYAALPDSTRRELTEDEELLLERQTPKPRRRLV